MRFSRLSKKNKLLSVDLLIEIHGVCLERVMNYEVG